MWINLDELLGLPKVTVVNYREIDGALFGSSGFAVKDV